MFCSPPDESPSQSTRRAQNPRDDKRKRKFNSKTFVKLFKSKSRFAVTMSSWAETFTVAATWQLKHQLAFWKAKAMALEYENKVLHDIVRKNHINLPQESLESQSDSEVVEVSNDSFEDEAENSEGEENSEEEEFEVSEEYIDFLRANAKYKEDARLERERLKAKLISEEDVIEQLEAGPSKPVDPKIALKDLYGSNWMGIAALEMAAQSTFINQCDHDKPIYWPNIPFNFNFN